MREIASLVYKHRGYEVVMQLCNDLFRVIRWPLLMVYVIQGLSPPGVQCP